MSPPYSKLMSQLSADVSSKHVASAVQNTEKSSSASATTRHVLPLSLDPNMMMFQRKIAAAAVAASAAAAREKHAIADTTMSKSAPSLRPSAMTKNQPGKEELHILNSPSSMMTIQSQQHQQQAVPPPALPLAGTNTTTPSLILPSRSSKNEKDQSCGNGNISEKTKKKKRRKSISGLISPVHLGGDFPAPPFFCGKEPRSGKWTQAEDQYAQRLIREFDWGYLSDCPTGTTLRNYLSRKLHCNPMRISKKFAGTNVGKKMYHARPLPPHPSNLSEIPLHLVEASFYRSVEPDRFAACCSAGPTPPLPVMKTQQPLPVFGVPQIPEQPASFGCNPQISLAFTGNNLPTVHLPQQQMQQLPNPVSAVHLPQQQVQQIQIPNPACAMIHLPQQQVQQIPNPACAVSLPQQQVHPIPNPFNTMPTGMHHNKQPTPLASSLRCDPMVQSMQLQITNKMQRELARLMQQQQQQQQTTTTTTANVIPVGPKTTAVDGPTVSDQEMLHQNFLRSLKSQSGSKSDQSGAAGHNAKSSRDSTRKTTSAPSKVTSIPVDISQAEAKVADGLVLNLNKPASLNNNAGAANELLLGFEKIAAMNSSLSQVPLVSNLDLAASPGMPPTPTITSKSFDDMHRFLGHGIPSMPKFSLGAQNPAVAGLAPDEEKEEPQPTLMKPLLGPATNALIGKEAKVEPGCGNGVQMTEKAAVVDTEKTAKDKESDDYALLAQESAMAVMQHSAYALSSSDKAKSTLGVKRDVHTISEVNSVASTASRSYAKPTVKRCKIASSSPICSTVSSISRRSNIISGSDRSSSELGAESEFGSGSSRGASSPSGSGSDDVSNDGSEYNGSDGFEASKMSQSVNISKSFVQLTEDKSTENPLSSRQM